MAVINDKLIGSRIRAARLQSGYTQEQAASKLQVTEAYWSRIENGRARINLERLYDICQMFHLNEMNLLNECCTYFRKRHIKHEVLLSDISSIPEQEPMETLVVSRIDFMAALSCLNVNLQKVIHMHYGQGMEIREIAALMKRPDGTVKRMLFQARSQIRAAS